MSPKSPFLKDNSLWGVVTYVVDKPQSLAIIFALVMLGMFIGVVPSVFLKSQESMDKKIDTIVANQVQIQAAQLAAKERADTRTATILDRIDQSNTRNTQQTEKLIQIMRGMCLIIAKQNVNDTALCNP